MKESHMRTKLAHTGDLELAKKIQSSVSVPKVLPIYMSSVFTFDDVPSLDAVYAGEADGYVYSRMTNPSTDAAEEMLAAAEGADGALVFSSGMAAIINAIIANMQAGDHIVSSPVLYGGVYDYFKHELPRFGVEVTFVEFDDPAKVEAAIRPNTKVVYTETISNPLMEVNDLPAIAAACRRKSPNLIFHADCVQSFCRLPIDPVKWGIQLVSVSGHKIHAPKGTGALYIAKGTRLLPPLYGSGQEKGLRPGTENVPGIAALGLAAQLMNDRCAENFAHFTALRQRMITKLSQSPAVCINSPADAAPYIVNCSVQGIRSEVMIHYLEQFGIYVSSGSACAKGERSHVLTAMGLSRDRIDSAVRVSMTDTTTAGEIDEFCRRLLEGEATLTKRR
mgnify:CR=1 FL=1